MHLFLQMGLGIITLQIKEPTGSFNRSAFCAAAGEARWQSMQSIYQY
jgi:hypothetical protein